VASQPVPKVTEADFERLLAREFPNDAAAARGILEQYGTEKWERDFGLLRVRIAVLKLAEGNLESLQRHLATAKQDPRDVVAFAEYPAAFGAWNRPKSTDTEEQQRYDADWNQYAQWFARR
jgi:hypothetical protein